MTEDALDVVGLGDDGLEAEAPSTALTDHR